MRKVRFQTVAVDGFNVFYREAGPRDAPAALLLPRPVGPDGASEEFDPPAVVPEPEQIVVVFGPLLRRQHGRLPRLLRVGIVEKVRARHLALPPLRRSQCIEPRHIHIR